MSSCGSVLVVITVDLRHSHACAHTHAYTHCTQRFPYVLPFFFPFLADYKITNLHFATGNLSPIRYNENGVLPIQRTGILEAKTLPTNLCLAEKIKIIDAGSISQNLKDHLIFLMAFAESHGKIQHLQQSHFCKIHGNMCNVLTHLHILVTYALAFMTEM